MNSRYDWPSLTKSVVSVERFVSIDTFFPNKPPSMYRPLHSIDMLYLPLLINVAVTLILTFSCRLDSGLCHNHIVFD